MRGFLQRILRYPMVTALGITLAGLLGVASVLHLPVDLFPNLEVPVVNIVAHDPGAAPTDTERLVSMPVEQAMRTIPGVTRVASVSVQGISRVTIAFRWGTRVADARQLVQARLARLRGRLPEGVHPSLENIGTTLQEVCDYVVYGAADPVTLRNTVRHDIAGRLMGVDGVSTVQVLGGDRRAFNVSFRPAALARLHLSIPDVIALLQRQNLSTVAGFMTRGGREYLVRGDARLRTLEDLRSIPVLRRRAGTVLLGSVATIAEGRVPRHYTVHGDGVPAVALIVRKQPGVSTIRVVSDVAATMARIKALLPPGATVKRFFDQSEIIREARDEVVRDLLLGTLLAVLVLRFFLGALRPTLIVALTIPLTEVVTFAVMRCFGLGLNVITMTALALAAGMIVDDAIVVAESIFRHRETGSDPVRASIEGAVEIAGPDASGTFTTVAAFLPLIMVGGIAALFLRPFGITLSAALLVSLCLSLTLVPLLFGRSRRTALPKRRFAGARLLRALDRLLQAALRFSLRHRAVTLALAALFLGAAVLAAGLGRAAVLPPLDEGAILVEYVMPPGTSLEESDRVGADLERIALRDPDVSCVYRRTGSPATGYQVESVNMGEMLIKLAPRAVRHRTVSEIMAALKKAYAPKTGMAILYHQPTQEKIDESFSGLPALFGVTLYGVDMRTLISLASRVEKILSGDPAIAGVVNNAQLPVPQVDVRLDRSKLAAYGMEPGDVLATLRAARFGLDATRIIRQKEQVFVRVRLDAGALSDPDRIRQLPLAAADGSLLPLGRVATVSVRRTPAAIARLNGQRVVTLVAEVEGSIPAVVSRLRERLHAVHLPNGYSLAFRGQYRSLLATARELLFALAAAVGLIYLILVIQFRSWTQPLIVLVTIPLAMVGALIALVSSGQGLDISVGMGAVTLVGITVNNAIVLLDYANRARRQGAPRAAALREAASVRLRPILLTTLTTVAALAPAAFLPPVGSRIFQPFAITVIGGLASSLCATLIVVPTLVAGRR